MIFFVRGFDTVLTIDTFENLLKGVKGLLSEPASRPVSGLVILLLVNSKN